MKKNNKGFTVIELLASFTLTMVIVVFLFEILIELKDLYYESGVKTEVLHSKSMLVDKVRSTLDTSELSGVSCVDDTCTFNFSDIDPIKLTIDDDNNTIIYGDDKITFPDEVEFKSYGISTCPVKDGKPTNDLGLMDGTTAKNCYVTLKIVIASTRLDRDYDINLVYPYKYDPAFVTGDLAGKEDTTGSTVKYVCDSTQKTFTADKTGTYSVELLGASGGASNNGKIAGGNGAYTKGEIYLNKGESIYINVGCKGSKTTSGVSNSTTGGYNGGGNGTTATSGIAYAGGGGGATDIRIGGSSLYDRVMVAAGGSGAGNGSDAKAGTAGGSIIAANSNNSAGPKGATQTTGGKAGSGGAVGTFGKGANATTLGGGGGGGYYGGAGGIKTGTTGTSGTGGSSFISGYLGSNSVTSASSATATNQPIHYSGRVFYNTTMADGDHLPSGKSSESFYSQMPTDKQNPGDGYAVITYESSSIPDEALKLSGSKSNYDLADAEFWLDGYDNNGNGIHNYKITNWHDLAQNKHPLTLTKTNWVKDGLNLSSVGTLSTRVGSGFTLSVAITLDAYPSSLQRIIQGKAGLYITNTGAVGFNNGASDFTFDYKIPSLHTKQYLTVVATGSQITLFVNGKSVSTKTASTTEASSTTLTLPGTLSGTLHKVMLYNTTLSDTRVKDIFEEDKARYGSYNVNLDNKSLEYNFSNEGGYNTSTKKVTDVSGNENHGTINGNMSVPNNGLVLDGSTNYITFKGDINYRYSIDLIVSNTANSGTNPNLIGDSTYPALFLNSASSYAYSFKAQGLNASFGKNYTVNKKEYITLTYAGANIILYINGTRAGSLATTTDPVSIANAYIGKYFKGNIHKYAVYDRSLTENEVKALYESNYGVFS